MFTTMKQSLKAIIVGFALVSALYVIAPSQALAGTTANAMASGFGIYNSCWRTVYYTIDGSSTSTDAGDVEFYHSSDSYWIINFNDGHGSVVTHTVYQGQVLVFSRDFEGAICAHNRD